MVYSCAYYENVSENLEQSQRNELDHIYRSHWDTKERIRTFSFQRNRIVWALLVSYLFKNAYPFSFYPKLNDSIHCDYLQDTILFMSAFSDESMVVKEET